MHGETELVASALQIKWANVMVVVGFYALDVHLVPFAWLFEF